MLKTTLLVLTMMQDGAVRVTLSETGDMAECEISRDTVVTILTEAGNPPLAAVCDETDLRLTPFIHGVPEEAETNRYRVEIIAGRQFVITPLDEGEPCDEAEAEDRHIYCTRSAQEVIAP